MNVDQARAILQGAYGPTKRDAKGLCFGDCCLRATEKKALLTLIFPKDDEPKG